MHLGSKRQRRLCRLTQNKKFNCNKGSRFSNIGNTWICKKMAKDKKEEKIKGRGEIIIYKAKGGPRLDVRLDDETIWLNLNQIAKLFSTDKSGISRHIKNVYKDGELDENSTVAKIATVQTEGKRTIKRDIEYYNLDLIISVGYRVNSKQATQFRIWATNTLRSHILKGYTINEKRLLETKEKFDELQEAIGFLNDKAQKKQLSGQEGEVLRLLSSYAKTLSTLEAYDKGALKDVKGKRGKFVLTYDASRKIISELKRELTAKKEAGDLFGLERDGSFEGIISGLYQAFGGKEVYPSIEDKAAHLLYFIIKDHPFSDGNKRSAAFLFVYFLDKNNYLYKSSGERKINDNALAALALLVAESEPKEKETMVKIIKNLINE